MVVFIQQVEEKQKHFPATSDNIRIDNKERARKYELLHRKFLYFLIFCIVFVLMSRVFTNVPGDRGSIPGQVIPETQKMVLDSG